MKFASVGFPIILLAMTSQAYALCQIGDTQNCTVDGRPGIKVCDPHTHMFGVCQTLERPVVGTVAPRYYVLTVVYAPPGTKGTGQSSVSYSQGSSTGSTTSTSHSFKNELSVSSEVKIGSKANNVSIGGSFEWDKSKTDGTATEIKKTNKSTIAASGPASDGIDHEHDIIYLWLNPRVKMAILQSAKKVSWTFDGTATADIQHLFVGWLKDPSKLPPGVLQALQRNGITPQDYQDILRADPFADGSVPVASDRYMPLHTTIPYEPPFAPGDPVPTFTYALDNSTTVTETHSHSTDIKVGVKVDTSFFNEVWKSTAKDTATWTWSCGTTTSNGTMQSASVTIGGPSFGYTGPTDIAVYYDLDYQTFAFAPFQGALKSLHGTVTSQAGTPLRGQEVIAVAGGTKYRTFTNARGEYRFFDRIVGPVELHAGALHLQVPKVESGKTIDLHL
jgi:hypothetical protein